jgi:protein SCO1/2
MKQLVLGMVLLVATASLAVAAVSMRPRRALPVYGRLPDFTLVDQRGAPFTTASMAGHVSVVDFIFTRCPSACPRLTATMVELQRRLAGQHSAARLVSFSVDPDNDTPPVLTAYAARAGADPARWSFVTGPPDDVERAVVLGFKVSAARIEKGAADYDVTHGNWFVLVDPQGNLRGYYATDEAGALDALVRDATNLGNLSR